MISAYKGEFLVSPIPLEIDLNYCSHKSELKQMIPKGHPSRSKLIKAGSKG